MMARPSLFSVSVIAERLIGVNLRNEPNLRSREGSEALPEAFTERSQSGLWGKQNEAKQGGNFLKNEPKLS